LVEDNWKTEFNGNELLICIYFSW